MSAVVEFEDVVAVTGSFPVLTGVDVSVNEGEIVLVRGENGAGKTSFLRACAGLLRVSAGSARVLGFDMRVDRRTPRRYIGLLGHENNLYRDLWAKEHVEFRAAAGGGPKSDAEAALAKVGFPSTLWSVPISALSAGQRRKVAIASVIATRPRLWLLDEPHAALDAESRTNLNSVLREAASAGATVVFASHESALSKELSSRVITLQGGRVAGDSGAS
ncbi:MAG: heme ABC exporter ATP-binding protein CcmA [Acidimicrobiales bacterium]|jgi:heme ABC exporter ATP-binding subunit CcmA|nr:heme ABC exporter ATP-binding protein CcmA [Acidimicrobiales bacterium]